jgi:hypothetical protein
LRRGTRITRPVISVDAQIIFQHAAAGLKRASQEPSDAGGLPQGAAALQARTSPPDLLLQIVDRDFSFRECNYSLYPSWLSYPWANSHFLIRGARPYRIERHDRPPLHGAPLVPAGLHDQAGRYHEGLDAPEVIEALRDFASTAAHPALVRLNLNIGNNTRKLAGPLIAFGCRLASVRKNGELALLDGAEFSVPLDCEAEASARGDGLRVRHRILIQPGTQVRFSLPLELARLAGKRRRPGFRIEGIEPLPCVFADATTFRALWPDSPHGVIGQRYAIGFDIQEAGSRPADSRDDRG